MSPSMVSGIGLVVVVGALGLINASNIATVGSTTWSRYGEFVAGWHDRLFILGSSRRYVIKQAVLAFGLGASVLWLVGLFYGVLAFVLVAAAPVLMFRLAWKRRLERFDEQVIDALRSLANSLRAGLVLPQAFEVVVDNMTAPISQEFGLALKEYHLGTSLEEALGKLANRMKSERFTVVLSSLYISRKAGGDVARVLDDTADALEEIGRLEGKIKSTTAQGKLQVLVMSLMPPVFMLLVYYAQPEMITILFHDPLGQLILFCIVILELIGILLMRKILLVEV